MDMRGVLDQMLKSGTELAQRGRELAEDKLRIPESGSDREAMLSGLKKGAVAGGLMALLLGTRAGRRVGGSALKLGGIAALGTIAYKAYQSWSDKQGQPITEQPLAEIAGPEADRRSTQLMLAMIAAAKADGHIDQHEYQRIQQQVEQMELQGDVKQMIMEELAKPLDVRAVAAGATNPASAAETYLASLMVIDVDSDVERQYLRDLAAALGLSSDYASHLEASLK